MATYQTPHPLHTLLPLATSSTSPNKIPKEDKHNTTYKSINEPPQQSQERTNKRRIKTNVHITKHRNHLASSATHRNKP